MGNTTVGIDLQISVISIGSTMDGDVCVHHIDAIPEMPPLKATATLAGDNVPSLDQVMFSWRLEITYQDTVRSDIVRYPDTGWEQSNGAIWSPQQPSLAGGDLTVFCQLQLPDATILNADTSQQRHRILGENPNRVNIRGSVPQGERYQAILWQESRFTQFKDGAGVSNAFVAGAHYPIRGVDPGGTIGYGLGQLTTPEPSIRDLWDWGWNVTTTLQRLDGFRGDALTYLGQVRAGSSWDATTGGKPPNEGVAYANAPDFTADQLNLEMYSRFNSGYRYHDYDPDSGEWIRRLAPGSDSGTSLPYADQVLGAAQQAASGNPPLGWT